VLDLPAAFDPDDALSQPTRSQLFALLGELKRPAGTGELAERLELHPNGVRLHLERLEQAGLVERTRVPSPRGRPPDIWRISPGARPAGQKPRAYRDLGRWLARALTTHAGDLGNIESIGREIGHELAPKDVLAESGAEALETTLTALGFQPAVSQREGDQLTCCLGNCPYAEAVRENQPGICELHKGITRGLLDVLEPGAQLAAFIPHDPDEAGCLIELRGVDEPALTS
jgi:predicted ArsR family transcriptional regulator